MKPEPKKECCEVCKSLLCGGNCPCHSPQPECKHDPFEVKEFRGKEYCPKCVTPQPLKDLEDYLCYEDCCEFDRQKVRDTVTLLLEKTRADHEILINTILETKNEEISKTRAEEREKNKLFILGLQTTIEGQQMMIDSLMKTRQEVILECMAEVEQLLQHQITIENMRMTNKYLKREDVLSSLNKLTNK